MPYGPAIGIGKEFDPFEIYRIAALPGPNENRYFQAVVGRGAHRVNEPCDDAELIRKFGDVPEDLSAL